MVARSAEFTKLQTLYSNGSRKPIPSQVVVGRASCGLQ